MHPNSKKNNDIKSRIDTLIQVNVATTSGVA